MTDQAEWIEIVVKMDPGHLEQVSPDLFRIGCEGIHEREGEFSTYFASARWSAETYQILMTVLRQAVPDFTETDVDVIDVPFRNWNEEWKKGFAPFHPTPQLIIQPDWETIPPEKGEMVITIAPKMAFGTGHHETTRLVLQLMPSIIRPGNRVLDVGTGSGILAIYAAKLGAAGVLGVDNDPVAMENFYENAELNNVVSTVQGITGTLDQVTERGFDAILANINRNVLLDLASILTELIMPDGRLILSGILTTDAERVQATYEATGWECLQTKSENEWMAMVLRRIG